MRNLKFTTIVLFLTLFCNSVFSQTQSYEKDIKITVEINYGKEKPKQTVKVVKANSITALEALQLAAIVETHTVGSYVFVTSINNVKGKRGKTAWYYKVNGQSAKTLAINNELQNGDTIIWTFKEDVCSKTVDN